MVIDIIMHVTLNAINDVYYLGIVYSNLEVMYYANRKLWAQQ